LELGSFLKIQTLFGIAWKYSLIDFGKEFKDFIFHGHLVKFFSKIFKNSGKRRVKSGE